MIIAKQVNQEVVDNGYYELYKPVEMTGVDGEKVDVLQSIGSYSLAQLESEKQNYLDAITEVEEKITAINNLK